MSTPVITQRNRANAQHSTGPVTAEGKARSSQNALKLGLSITRHVILPHEDPAEFEALHADLLRIYGPQSPREEIAVEEIAHCRWAFRRFDEAEMVALSTPIVDNETGEPIQEIPPLTLIAAIPASNGKPHPRWGVIHNLTRYRGHWERRHQRAIADFDRACIARHREARERRAQERHDMAAERHQIARERREQALARRPAPKAEPTPTANTNKTNGKPQSGFVPYSEPEYSIPAATTADTAHHQPSRHAELSHANQS